MTSDNENRQTKAGIDQVQRRLRAMQRLLRSLERREAHEADNGDKPKPQTDDGDR